MRQIVAFDRVSADGYFAAADGGLGWVVPEEELDRAAAQNLSGSGTILFGRRTYDMFESFWPHALDANPHAPGQHSPEIRAMAQWINDAEKIVFSRTRTEVPWRNSRLLPEFDPREIEALKSRPGNGIMIFGSGSIVSQLTEHGLIDEYHFIVAPILLGGGRTLVSGVPASVRLDLVEATPFPSGNVRLRYARRSSSPPPPGGG
ncbi:dihydrofolate reductase family protein [Longimicrobium sp.]|uniref:dihydrofolate reductase family protein n=1 Tax=Longimicrobium sp. TaxID=2029185 RepID=UPI002CDA4BBA|nr:dihydrofolate reductase family protein [Longimicrobium sp.]HSU15488.1 dihydrofolate reductase family protein [Longimicrobium sp.]